MNKIYVTKSFLPPEDEYMNNVHKIFETYQLTNNGPLLQELEQKLSAYLEVLNLQCVTNGTIALQLALKALDIENGEIITTPFSYVATTSSILWERCQPIFVDIESNNFTMDVTKIEDLITPKTKAIMPVHVFGYACNVERIEQIATKHNLKVIYDAAHAFGSKYKGKSLTSYGDISTLSFHATKLFHTIEGGACICKDKKISEKLDLHKRFGHNGDNHFCLGVNAKMSEVHAAMGLANFPYIEDIILQRKFLSDLYDNLLSGRLIRPKKQIDLDYNYAYYPVVFENEKQLLQLITALNNENIYPRRYFYPSLNTLPYLEKVQSCPISEGIASRILCLPLYYGLEEKVVKKIAEIVNEKI